MRIFILFSIFLLLFGCLQNDSEESILSDSCGGAQTPINELKSYCADINIEEIKLIEKNGKYGIVGIEELELAGFEKTNILTSAEYEFFESVVDGQGDSYIECFPDWGAVVFDRQTEKGIHEIALWAIFFDGDTKDLKEIDCWCDNYS